MLMLMVVALITVIFKIQKHYLKMLHLIGGRKLVLIPAFFFVPIHELSHLVVAFLCGHKINKVSFFQNNGTGTLGFVEHSYKPSFISPFTNLLIGIAPIAGGALSVVGLYYALGLHEGNCSSLAAHHFFVFQGQEIFNPVNFIVSSSACADHYRFLIWLLISVNIMVFAIPSRADFIGAKWGLITTAIVLLFTTFTPAFSQVYEFMVIGLNSIVLPSLLVTVVLFLPVNLCLMAIVKLINKE